jgi:hypothetical protein
VLWIALLVPVALLALVGIWFLHRFYAKATLDSALVRTGFGGRRVITDGGCIALPILHQMQKVSMGALNFSISRQGREAVLTRDRMRADVIFGFELRVSPTEEGIATAAQALPAAATVFTRFCPGRWSMPFKMRRLCAAWSRYTWIAAALPKMLPQPLTPRQNNWG